MANSLFLSLLGMQHENDFSASLRLRVLCVDFQSVKKSEFLAGLVGTFFFHRDQVRTVDVQCQRD